ncbi:MULTISPECIES: hypothetical protein [Streptomyces]|uniref:hypothetical protein n=1 Tax=Streptomyces TaxID=1883 RepID=UPI001E49E6F3|nr:MULTISPECIES: hypothetical protein [Streptomyces]UFQ15602.1 hypothetical protein J2N69_11680 [Streptomyces huasconensis]WCL85204.1 hypothetical protein PPN52_11690 [Streptomyces sp. JCM 35825]
MGALGAIVALLVVLFLVVGVYATVKVVRAAKRGVDRTISEARRTVEDTTLRAKSFAQVGTAGELAQLRLKLRTSMRSTQDVLQAGSVEDASLKESLGLFDRLSAHGHELDEELRRLERDPDKATVAERLPELKERTEHITQAADSLRWVARDRASRFADDDLQSLRTQIDMEAGALRHWATEPPPAQTPAAWPEPAAESATGGEQTWSEPSSAAQPAQEPARPAITPPTPAPTYPWQKKAKPESTT